ncbi:apolipoprotein N-acyltransferase [Deinococcus cellulosilyticus NBRC 106333 = KACC 11606]|uniref:Apolipoprotein N-acyltransferase n=1 Tax=Deinococcus cellulosilyticus (strain DSM 18568 / NBRC 106333 / KACC 11606 / 5516J-15) TaxID=1223518 RepID=A0A511N2P0_DEIC1|nr:apolipoprotein N-acyltransferase [Deinococcus cellulosilyticus NBRC 106333 = KACC 11606]
MLLGAGTGLLFLTTKLSWLTPVLLGVLFSQLPNTPSKGVFVRVFWFAVGFFTLHLWWLPASLGALFGPISYLLFALMVPILAGMWAFTAALTRLLYGGNVLLALPFSWVVMEHLRSLGVFQFTWGTLGYLWVGSPVAQVADVGGVYLLSLLGMLLACFLAQLPRISPVLFFTLPLLGAAVVAGLAPTSTPPGALKAALVQGSIPPEQKARGRQQDELSTYLSLSQGVPDDALVVWPETASPVALDEKRKAELLHINPRWLVGAPRWDGDRSFNSVTGLSASGSAAYDKRILVPFGERFPLQDQLPEMYRWVFSSMGLPELRGVTPGTVQTPLEVGGVRYGTYICYESTFPDLTRQLVKKGAQVLVNVSNDSWFGQGLGARQHFLMGTVRAIETRRYLLRAGNDGITAVVGPEGETLTSLPRGVRGVLLGKYTPMDGETLYVKYGNWVVGLSWLVLLALLAHRSPWQTSPKDRLKSHPQG